MSLPGIKYFSQGIARFSAVFVRFGRFPFDKLPVYNEFYPMISSQSMKNRFEIGLIFLGVLTVVIILFVI